MQRIGKMFITVNLEESHFCMAMNTSVNHLSGRNLLSRFGYVGGERLGPVFLTSKVERVGSGRP